MSAIDPFERLVRVQGVRTCALRVQRGHRSALACSAAPSGFHPAFPHAHLINSIRFYLHQLARDTTVAFG